MISLNRDWLSTHGFPFLFLVAVKKLSKNQLPVFYNSTTPYSPPFMTVNTKERLVKYYDCIKTKTGLMLLGQIPW